MSDLPVVEKGVPVAERLSPEKTLFNFVRDLEVGDSFVVSAGRASTIRGYATMAGYKLTFRKQPENMVRIWRRK